MQRLSCKITDYRTEKLWGSVISVGHLARFVGICWLSTRTLVIPTFISQNSRNIRRLTCKTPSYPIASLSCKTPPIDNISKNFSETVVIPCFSVFTMIILQDLGIVIMRRLSYKFAALLIIMSHKNAIHIKVILQDSWKYESCLARLLHIHCFWRVPENQLVIIYNTPISDVYLPHSRRFSCISNCYLARFGNTFRFSCKILAFTTDSLQNFKLSDVCLPRLFFR